MTNPANRKSYFYSGPVYRFNDIVKQKWEGGTTALTPKQALSNITYKCKISLGIIPDTRVHLDPKYLKSV